MMNLDKDSVVNFLTPTKLVQGTLRPRPKGNLNDSYRSNSSKRHEQDIPQYSFAAQFEKLSSGATPNLNYLNYQADPMRSSRQRSKVQSDHLVNLNDRSMSRKEDSFKLMVQEKGQREQPRVDSQWMGQQASRQVQDYSGQPVGQVLARLNNSHKSSRVVQNNSRSIQHSRQQLSLNSTNKNVYRLQGTTQQLSRLMSTLKSVKDNIDFQLSELQALLDNTSRHLNDINQEYLRVKQRVLDYTSQVMDAAFSKYKQNMVNWMKYEEIQKKAIAIIGQLDKTIIQDEIVVSQMIKNTSAPRVAVGKQQELNQKIQFYQNFNHQLKDIKAECLSMRPQLKRDRIIQFERALAALTDF